MSCTEWAAIGVFVKESPPTVAAARSYHPRPSVELSISCVKYKGRVKKKERGETILKYIINVTFIIITIRMQTFRENFHCKAGNAHLSHLRPPI